LGRDRPGGMLRIAGMGIDLNYFGHIFLRGSVVLPHNSQ
jgi:hypothetical protein